MATRSPLSFIRDYVYVDVEKSRGLLAQLDGGVSEELVESSGDDRSSEGGINGFMAHRRSYQSGYTLTKSMGDALFSSTEELLEVHGFINDVSSSLTTPGDWLQSGTRGSLRAGDIIRITAPGILYDARYIAGLLGGFVATYLGLNDMGIDVTKSSPPTGRGAPKGANTRQGRSSGVDQPQLEDVIPNFPPMGNSDGFNITPEFLRGIVKVSRGIYTPGVHVNMLPTTSTDCAVTARLQEGRAFLDAEPDILFARYGVTPQMFTLVGSIGHFAPPAAKFVSTRESAIDSRGNVSRPKMALFINEFLRFMGSLGFADLPQEPGFSVIPIALYRTIEPAAHRADPAS